MLNYYLGIDASKGYADFVILDVAKQPIDRGFQLDDTAEGHHKLRDYLDLFFHHHTNAVLYTAVESTGGYENNWHNYLNSISEELSLHVARINPAWVKSNSDASAQRNKTDAISAKDIAEYQITHPEKIAYDEENYPTLRRQWTLIKMYIKQKKQLLNQLDSHLYSTMPELLTFCRQGVPTWLLKLLVIYPGYQQLLQATESRLEKIAYISSKKAQRIIALVQKGIGSNDRVSSQILSSLASQILHMDELIIQQKQLLENNYEEASNEIELLTSFNGIGVYSAVGLLINIVNIKRFSSAKKLSCYFGIHPVYKKSGDGLWGMHMSKKGRSEPRAILYMVAWSAIQYNPLIKKLYARCLSKGMHKSSAMGVCMHKILRIVYGMLKNMVPFDPEIDRENRECAPQQSQKTMPSKKRRFQNFDENAPTSRKQYKKRKEQTRSQDGITVASGITKPVPNYIPE